MTLPKGANPTCEDCGKPNSGRRFCRKCAVKGDRNPAFGHAYRTKETHPEWAEKVSKTSKERQINSGDKNGMKQPEARAKASKTRKAKFANDPEFKEMIAECTRQAWADGKYDDVPVGNSC